MLSCSPTQQPRADLHYMHQTCKHACSPLHGHPCSCLRTQHCNCIQQRACSVALKKQTMQGMVRGSAARHGQTVVALAHARCLAAGVQPHEPHNSHMLHSMPATHIHKHVFLTCRATPQGTFWLPLSHKRAGMIVFFGTLHFCSNAKTSFPYSYALRALQAWLHCPMQRSHLGCSNRPACTSLSYHMQPFQIRP